MGQIRAFSERQKLPVAFSLPTGDRKYLRLKAEVSCDRQWAHGDYRFLLQELGDDDGEWGDSLVRMTYYRRPRGGSDSSWHFGGQWSITASKDVWVELLSKGKKEDWFKAILDEAGGA